MWDFSSLTRDPWPLPWKHNLNHWTTKEVYVKRISSLLHVSYEHSFFPFFNFLVTLKNMWDLSSWTWDQTHTLPALDMRSLNY